MRDIRLFEFSEGAVIASKWADIVVVIDVLRSSSTIVTALNCGFTQVNPLIPGDSSTADIRAGEHFGRKLDECELDNSPTDIRASNFNGASLDLYSTNGTPCIKAASASAKVVVIGSVLNLSSSARFIKKNFSQFKKIGIVAAGTREKSCAADLHTSLLLSSLIEEKQMEEQIITPGIIYEYFKKTISGQRLIERGRNDDIVLSSQVDLYPCVPLFSDGTIKIMED